MPPREAIDPDEQLALFASANPMVAVYDEIASLARELPSNLRMGTSSWSFPGWHGLVYGRPRSESWLAREGLREFAKHPLMRTVGVDRSYYSPIPEEDLERFGTQLPEGFLCCFKAPAAVTSVVVVGSDRSGQGVVNPDFLSPKRFEENLGRRLVERFASHTGIVMLEFPRTSELHTLRSEEFCERLSSFLSAVSGKFSFAIELREAMHFTPRYLKTLRLHGVSHVYNWWTAMPSLLDQARAIAPEEMPHVVMRVMLPRGGHYEERKRDFSPFHRICEAHEEMRDEVATLAKRSLAAGRPTWVLASNKAEGCAPLTVRAIAERMVR
jgi:uncharacterized protein YecE (DUF72 family)